MAPGPNSGSAAQQPSGVRRARATGDKRAVVGVDGKWYDVETLLETHPGGPILKSFVGKDASDVFHAFHAPSVLAKRTAVGSYDPDDRRRSADLSEADVAKYKAVQADYRALEQKFREEGWFEPAHWWLARQAALCAALFAAMLAVVLVVTPRCEGWAVGPVLAGVLLAAFWQQCGFLMHDFMHSSVLQDRRADGRLGSFFGTVCLGVPASWWKDEHDVHHALTNMFTFDAKSPDFDIQMLQRCWAQDEQLVQFVDGSFEPYQRFPSMPRWFTIGLVRVQHLTFLPLCVVLGRFAILLDSYRHETRASEWTAIRVHWAWVSVVLLLQPSLAAAALFYATAGVCQGVLHVQLLVSHFAEPMESSVTSLAKSFFVTHQTETCTNISNWRVTDWFYGGLNFHLEHHLFPRLPRQRLRAASVHVRAFCAKHDLEYKEASFFAVVAKVITHLRDVGHLVPFPDVRHL